ncbi:MAG: hypothetical protein LBC41_15710 [Clostridiales bacterium]|nr:hypothetical protein [Clostridiales bacterium]
MLLSALPFSGMYSAMARTLVSSLAGTQLEPLQLPPTNFLLVLADIAQFLLSIPLMVFFKKYFGADPRLSHKLIGFLVMPICAAVASAIGVGVLSSFIIGGGSQVFSAIILILLILALLGLGIYGLTKLSSSAMGYIAVWTILIAAGQIATMFFTYFAFAVILYMGSQSGFLIYIFPTIVTTLIVLYGFGLVLSVF